MTASDIKFSSTTEVDTDVKPNSQLAVQALTIVLQHSLMTPNIFWNINTLQSEGENERQALINYQESSEDWLDATIEEQEELRSDLIDTLDDAGFFDDSIINEHLTKMEDFSSDEWAETFCEQVGAADQDQVIRYFESKPTKRPYEFGYEEDSAALSLEQRRTTLHYSKSEFRQAIDRFIDEHWTMAMRSLRYQCIQHVKIAHDAYLDLHNMIVQAFIAQQSKFPQSALISHLLHYYQQCQRWLDLIELAISSYSLLPNQINNPITRIICDTVGPLNEFITEIEVLDAISTISADVEEALNHYSEEDSTIYDIYEELVESIYSLQNHVRLKGRVSTTESENQRIYNSMMGEFNDACYNLVDYKHCMDFPLIDIKPNISDKLGKNWYNRNSKNVTRWTKVLQCSIAAELYELSAGNDDKQSSVELIVHNTYDVLSLLMMIQLHRINSKKPKQSFKGTTTKPIVPVNEQFQHEIDSLIKEGIALCYKALGFASIASTNRVREEIALSAYTASEFILQLVIWKIEDGEPVDLTDRSIGHSIVLEMHRIHTEKYSLLIELVPFKERFYNQLVSDGNDTYHITFSINSMFFMFHDNNRGVLNRSMLSLQIQDKGSHMLGISFHDSIQPVTTDISEQRRSIYLYMVHQMLHCFNDSLSTVRSDLDDETIRYEVYCRLSFADMFYYTLQYTIRMCRTEAYELPIPPKQYVDMYKQWKESSMVTSKWAQSLDKSLWKLWLCVERLQFLEIPTEPLYTSMFYETLKKDLVRVREVVQGVSVREWLSILPKLSDYHHIEHHHVSTLNIDVVLRWIQLVQLLVDLILFQYESINMSRDLIVTKFNEEWLTSLYGSLKEIMEEVIGGVTKILPIVQSILPDTIPDKAMKSVCEWLCSDCDSDLNEWFEIYNVSTMKRLQEQLERAVDIWMKHYNVELRHHKHSIKGSLLQQRLKLVFTT